ncbi:hypothetical protein Dimus_008553, partial [Dionaea muscipula]
RNGAVGGAARSWRSCTKAKLVAVMEKLASVAVFVGVAHCLEKSKLPLAMPGEGWPRGGGRCSPRKVSLLARGREMVLTRLHCSPNHCPLLAQGFTARKEGGRVGVDRAAAAR